MMIVRNKCRVFNTWRVVPGASQSLQWCGLGLFTSLRSEAGSEDRELTEESHVRESEAEQ